MLSAGEQQAALDFVRRNDEIPVPLLDAAGSAEQCCANRKRRLRWRPPMPFFHAMLVPLRAAERPRRRAGIAGQHCTTRCWGAPLPAASVGGAVRAERRYHAADDDCARCCAGGCALMPMVVGCEHDDEAPTVARCWLLLASVRARAARQPARRPAASLAPSGTRPLRPPAAAAPSTGMAKKQQEKTNGANEKEEMMTDPGDAALSATIAALSPQKQDSSSRHTP